MSLKPNLIICFILKFSIVCESNIKTWTTNINYRNPNDWDLKRIPCSSDRIIFPENVIIYLDQPISAKQFVLPKNGQIVFGDKASIVLVENNNDEECSGTDIKWNPKEDNDWFDPYNWNQTILVYSSNQLIDEKKYSGASGDKNPIPHMERIPCIYDSVSFETNTSFKVKINTNIKIKVNSLQIWNKPFDTQDFQSFVASDVGKQLFSINDLNNNLVIDQNIICTDPTGCECGNENSMVMSNVCQSVLKYGCPSLQCFDPIRPIGHCCDICASMLTFGYKPDFTLDLVKGIIESFRRKPEYILSVGSYLHKLKTKRFQLIAVDFGEKGRADKMIKAIKQYFNDGPGIYSLQSIEIYSSTDWSEANVGLWMFFIFLIFILIGSAVGISYYIKKRRIGSHFAFARFRGFDNEDSVELQMGTTPHEALDPNSPIQISTSSVKYDVEPAKEVVTFENPVFKKHQLIEDQNADKQMSKDLTSVENPFFSTDD